MPISTKDFLNEIFILNYVCTDFLEGKKILKIEIIKTIVGTQIHDFIKAFNKIPFKDLPLLIHHEHNLLKILVKERLAGITFNPESVTYYSDGYFCVLEETKEHRDNQTP